MRHLVARHGLLLYGRAPAAGHRRGARGGRRRRAAHRGAHGGPPTEVPRDDDGDHILFLASSRNLDNLECELRSRNVDPRSCCCSYSEKAAAPPSHDCHRQRRHLFLRELCSCDTRAARPPQTNVEPRRERAPVGDRAYRAAARDQPRRRDKGLLVLLLAAAVSGRYRHHRGRCARHEELRLSRSLCNNQ